MQELKEFNELNYCCCYDCKPINTGFSPIKGRTQMVGADAVVVYYTPTQRDKFHAVDYFMSAKSQVRSLQGLKEREFFFAK
jgi:hypothetical protein